MNSSDLYIIDRGSGRILAAPDNDNFLSVLEPQPLILCAEYLSHGFSELQLLSARNRLTAARLLFVPIACPDGPPYRAGFIFEARMEVAGVPLKDHRQRVLGPHKAYQYRVAKSYTPWSWITEAESGRPGYFLTGHSGDSVLWRVFRVEMDAIGRTVITLAPVRFAPSCPVANFSTIEDAGLRLETETQYRELCERVRQDAYRDVATKARNIIEVLVAERLRRDGKVAAGELGKDLLQIKRFLEDKDSRASCGWTDLEYTLANKIRLVHAITHPERAAEGQSVRPEFAAGLIADFVELLKRWGYAEAYNL